jgi:hypothetical protein
MKPMVVLARCPDVSQAVSKPFNSSARYMPVSLIRYLHISHPLNSVNLSAQHYDWVEIRLTVIWINDGGRSIAAISRVVQVDLAQYSCGPGVFDVCVVIALTVVDLGTGEIADAGVGKFGCWWRTCVCAYIEAVVDRDGPIWIQCL